MGRPAIFKEPMTGAERQARSRAMQRKGVIERHPEVIANRVATVLCELDYVNAAAADKALALIARDIAKRRKARSDELAEHRRNQRRLRRYMESGT